MTNRAHAGIPTGGQWVTHDRRRVSAGQVETSDESLTGRLRALASGDPRDVQRLSEDPDPVVRWNVLMRYRNEVLPSIRRRLEADPQVMQVERVFAPVRP